MAKIPLRAYIKEIENYIERGEIEQAVAHAKNILKSYPKHIDTYRLLGKAFLESQRYSEAADILQRVLSVIPDDFVSQIGMSIIREDEGNLDAAIWHMERAYEVQPFNPAVQDELRRLYGRRDGIEPPKIRLTRGALVRMYARGELYPQAIAETRAALSEDPQRLDLRVLLARLYFLSGHKNDAAEVCSELLSKLPYCYEANRLLAEILPSTSRAEEAKKFQQRMIALDPYEAFVSPSAPTSDQVPDQAVMVEQFIWDSALESSQQPPEWTRNIGVQWEESQEEALPDWLGTLKPETSTQVSPTALTQPEVAEEEVAPKMAASELSAPELAEQETPTAESTAETTSTESEDLVPNWMKEAGWSFSDRKADEIMASQPEEPASDEITPAEIPDWLQSMAPAESEQATPEEEERTEWLENLFTEQQPGSNGKETGPVADLGLVSAETSETSEEPVLPDWLNDLSKDENQPAAEGGAEMPSATAEAGQAEETPDWLLSFEEPSNEPSAEAPASPADQVEKVSGDEDLTGWLAAFASEANALSPSEQEPASPEAELPSVAELPTEAQLPPLAEVPAELPTEASAATYEASSVEETPLEAEPGEIPDWLKDLQTGAPSATAAVSDQEAAAQGLPEWLSGLEENAAEAQPEQSVAFAPTESEAVEQQKAEELPQAEELPKVDDLPQAFESVQAGEAPTTVKQPTDEAVMPNLDDMDATMAWLESLAARQGADEATLITSPEQRTDTPPEWVQEEVKRTGSLPPLPEAEASAPVEPSEAEFTEEGQADELRSWLAGLQIEGEPITEEIAPASQPVEELPPAEQLPGAEEQPIAGEQPTAAVEQTPSAEKAAAEAAIPDFSDMDAAMAWLESLAAKQGADEATLITPPDQRTETPPDWVMKETEAATLENAEAQLEPTQAETESAEAEEALPAMDLPDWLKSSEEQPYAEEQPGAVDQHTGSTTEAESVEPTQPLRISSKAQEPGEAEQPSEFEQPKPVEQPAAETAIPDFSDMDAAMAWLESLAAKQGADEATLVTPPEQRTETPPDWVLSQLETTGEEPQSDAGAAEQPAVEAELPDWLKEAAEARAESPVTAAEETTVEPETAPMTAFEETLPIEAPFEKIEQPETEEAPVAEIPPQAEELAQAPKQPEAETEMDMDSAFAWLESLAAKQGAQEGTLITTPEERQETPPEWVRQEAEQVQPEPEAEAPALEMPVEPKAEFMEPEAQAMEMEQPAAETAQPEAEAEQPPVEATQPLVEAEHPAPETEQAMAVPPQSEMEAGPTAASETWAAEVESAQPGPQTGEALPDWLKQVEMEEQPAAGAEPESIADWLKNLENEPETQASEPVIPPSPGDFRSAWAPEIDMAQASAAGEEAGQPPVVQQQAGQPQAAPASLTDLQEVLDHGNLEKALEGYNRLINNGEHLDETIHDLRDALYRYPVDISLWQALGDAFARNNQLQEALDAYTKAEELLR